MNEKADTLNNTGVRIYKPKNSAGLPLMIFFHGGGFICGNLDTEDAQCRHFAVKTPCIVISVDYPKVTDPSVRLPKILHEYGVPAVPWCRNRAQELGGDVSKTVLCGGSMASTLSAEITLHYISKGDTESITGLVLPFTVVYPYDHEEEGYTAWTELGNNGTPVLSLPLAHFIWSHFGIDFKDPNYLPGLSQDLSKWPPTYMISAEKDVCRDDAILFDKKLKAAGRPSKVDYYEGLPHYFHLFPQLAIAHQAMDAAVEGVRFVNTS